MTGASTFIAEPALAILRPYQNDLAADVTAQWAAGARNVVMRLDTGGGKTVILAHLIGNHAAAVIAHRQELVGQLSLALARNGVRHDIIAPDAVRRAIARSHIDELGRSYYAPGAPCRVAGVDTLINRRDELKAWASTVTRVVVDEAHHVIAGNKWGTAMLLFTNPACRGLFPTATPQRADGKGLGRHADGLADAMVQGPPMRWLIDNGYLTDYRMFCVESDMKLLEDDIGASGDWSTAKLRAAARGSHIVGDVVARYLEFAPGMLGVTFAPDVETAGEIQAQYVARGVPAALLTGKTDGGVRRHTIKRFARREILQLVVVDIISEGFDLPAIEVASMARKTASLATFMQQFGRALRPSPGKGAARIIDHVSNYLDLGPPDRPRAWTLDRRERRSGKSSGIPMRICLPWAEHPGCYQPYVRTLKACPYCSCPAPPPVGRSSPEMVDGDLSELDPETLARLRGAVDVVNLPTEAYRATLAAKHMPEIGQLAEVKRHHARQLEQVALRNAMDLWAGQRHAAGASDSEIQRLFWFTFGIDVLSALALGPTDAAALRGRIEA
ncbi:MAG: ATP-dependent helicase [Caulobacteraceae bacterium]|nr:ATP-dependent helicase [Caulobacteraceae bacterium]